MAFPVNELKESLFWLSDLIMYVGIDPFSPFPFPSTPIPISVPIPILPLWVVIASWCRVLHHESSLSKSQISNLKSSWTENLPLLLLFFYSILLSIRFLALRAREGGREGMSEW